MGTDAALTVSCHAISDRVRHNEHTRRPKLLAKVADAVGDEPVVHIHIGLMGKHIEVTLRDHLDGKRQFFCLFLFLLFQFGVHRQCRPADSY